MQKVSRKTKMFIAAAFVVGAAAVSTGAIQAATANSNANPMDNIVTAIATKFSLNKSDVQLVFDEQRTKMQAQRQQEFTDRINQAVTDGKLTLDQGNKIIAKHKEVQTFMEGLKDKSESERQFAMKTEMDALKQWATDNGISQQYLMFVGGYAGKGHGFGPKNGGHMMMGR